MRVISSAIIFLFLACFAVVAFAGNVETFHQTLEVADGTILDVLNANGSVSIEAWGEPMIDITAVKKVGVMGKFEHVRIDVLQPTEKKLEIATVPLVPIPHVSVAYTIKTPAGMLVGNVKSSNGSLELLNVQGTTMSLDTSDGSIRLQGVSGQQIDAKTSDGSITAKNVTGALAVKSSDGSIMAENITGSITAKTSDGSVTFRSVSGEANAETSNGSIEIRGASLLRRAKTSDGSIQADVLATQTADAEFKTSNGSIKLYLAPELQAMLDMKTSNGQIKLHEITLNVSEISGDKKIKGAFNGGGATMTLTTSDGNIELFPLQ